MMEKIDCFLEQICGIFIHFVYLLNLYWHPFAHGNSKRLTEYCISSKHTKQYQANILNSVYASQGSMNKNKLDSYVPFSNMLGKEWDMDRMGWDEKGNRLENII